MNKFKADDSIFRTFAFHLKHIYDNINNNNYLPLPHPSILINHPWLGKTMSRLNNRKFPYPNLSQRVKFTFWGARLFVRSFVRSLLNLLIAAFVFFSILSKPQLWSVHDLPKFPVIVPKIASFLLLFRTKHFFALAFPDLSSKQQKLEKYKNSILLFFVHNQNNL